MGFMLRLSLVAAATTAAVLLGSTAFAAAGVTPSSSARAGAGAGGGASLAAAPSLAPTLYDQNDNDGGDGFTSMSVFDTQAADDFVVPATEGWHVTSVFAPGSDQLDLSSVTVTIYGDSSGAPGARVYTVTVPSGSFTDDPGLFFYPGGNLTIPIDATLTPGHYWLSVQGDGSYWFWEIRGVVSTHPAMWQNPDDGFVSVCASGAIWRLFRGPGQTLFAEFARPDVHAQRNNRTGRTGLCGRARTDQLCRRNGLRAERSVRGRPLRRRAAPASPALRPCCGTSSSTAPPSPALH